MIFLHPAHINNIANIQHHNRALTHLTDPVDHILLCLSQTIASRSSIIILILTGGSSDNNQRNIIVTGASKHLIRNLHLLLAPGHTTPALSLIKRIFSDPILINSHQLLIQADFLTSLQCVQNSHNIPGIHQTTGSQSTLIIMKCHTSKNSNPFSFPKRQSLSFIFQQNAAFRCCLSGQCRISLKIQFIILHKQFSTLLLHIILIRYYHKPPSLHTQNIFEIIFVYSTWVFGNFIQISVPHPSSLRRVTLPFKVPTACFTIESPRPVPPISLE